MARKRLREEACSQNAFSGRRTVWRFKILKGVRGTRKSLLRTLVKRISHCTGPHLLNWMQLSSLRSLSPFCSSSRLSGQTFVLAPIGSNFRPVQVGFRRQTFLFNCLRYFYMSFGSAILFWIAPIGSNFRPGTAHRTYSKTPACLYATASSFHNPVHASPKHPHFRLLSILAAASLTSAKTLERSAASAL